ncbi:glycosyltransferase [bacterium]|nr:glycosyltransferase [bacterium]
MESGPDISVVIVSYNVKPYLEQTLRSVRRALEGIPAEIFVVDNASGDGSVSMVRGLFPGVRLIANDVNAGFAKANNQALRQAKGRAVCLINPDTIAGEDTFRVCLQALDARPEAGMIGCKVLNPDGTLQPACRRSFPTPWVAFTKVSGLAALFPRSRWFGRYNLTYLDPDVASEVEAVSGSFMFVRKEVLDTVGLLDEDFFMYGEDLDWCYRIRRAGWKIVYVPETRIVHYKGRSAQEASFDTIRVFDDAMHLFVRKHFRSGWYFLPMWLLRLGIWIRSGVNVLIRLAGRLAPAAVDVVLIQAGLAAAHWVRFGTLRHWNSYRVVDLLYTSVWIICLYAAGAYRKGLFSSAKASAGVLLGLVLNASLTFFLPQYAFSRKVVVLTGVFAWVLLAGWRLIIRFLPQFTHLPFLGNIGRTLLRRRAAVVGTGPDAETLFERLRRRIEAGYEMVGVIASSEKDLGGPAGDGPPRLGVLTDLPRIARTNRIQTVIFSPESIDTHRVVAAIAGSRGSQIDFKMAPRGLDLIIGSSSIDSIEDVPMMDLEDRIYRIHNRIAKRLTDLSAAVLLAPAWLVSLASLFLRKGIRLRRMPVAGDSADPVRVLRAFRGDAPAGGWTGLAPLFVDLLAGRISLVGSEMRPWEGKPDPVGFKPGMTGLVQIREGKGMSGEEKERVRLYYLRNYSYLLDIEILFKAVFRI